MFTKSIKYSLLSGLFLPLIVSLVMSLMVVNNSYAGNKHAAKRQQSSGGLDAAVNRVQRETGGRVLRAKREGPRYVIKVLMPSGVVKTYRVKAD